MRSSLLVFHRGTGSLDATTQRALGRWADGLRLDEAWFGHLVRSSC